jgi:transposase
MPKKARRFSRETKLAAVKRMLAGENVQALSRELNILRKDLYKWRANFLSGGPAALRGPGRPPKEPLGEESPQGAPGNGPQAGLSKAQSRIEELERKIRRQELELELIRQALGEIREKRRSTSRGH